jgi:tryptophan synthase alpha chain
MGINLLVAIPHSLDAADVAGFADGVIVGSALVRCLLDSPDADGVAAVRALTEELAAGVRRG